VSPKQQTAQHPIKQKPKKEADEKWLLYVNAVHQICSAIT